MLKNRKYKPGMEFNGIVVLEQRATGIWLCRCPCGREWVAKVSSVAKGRTRSCGHKDCDWRKRAATRGIRSNAYRAWISAVPRCERWSDFSHFLADMGEAPKGHELQIIDKSKPYSPDNCRWANPMQLGCHRRNNHWLTLDGITLHLTEWARISGILPQTISERFSRGWDVAEALTTPVRAMRGNHYPAWRLNTELLRERASLNFQNRDVASPHTV